MRITHIYTPCSHISLSICRMNTRNLHIIVLYLCRKRPFTSWSDIRTVFQLRNLTCHTLQTTSTRYKRIPMQRFFSRNLLIGYIFPLFKIRILNLILRRSSQSEATQRQRHQKLFHIQFSFNSIGGELIVRLRHLCFLCLYLITFFPFTT